MERSPSWEANRFSAGQEIPHILRNPMIQYRVYKCLPPVPILSQINPVSAPHPTSRKIHLNIILPSTPGFSKCSFYFRFSYHRVTTQLQLINISISVSKYTSALPRTCYMPHASQSSRLDHPDNIWWAVPIDWRPKPVPNVSSIQTHIVPWSYGTGVWRVLPDRHYAYCLWLLSQPVPLFCN